MWIVSAVPIAEYVVEEWTETDYKSFESLHNIIHKYIVYFNITSLTGIGGKQFTEIFEISFKAFQQTTMVEI